VPYVRGGRPSDFDRPRLTATMAPESPATTAARIIRFLHEYAGKEFCNRCLSERLFGGRHTDSAMWYVEGRGITPRYGQCSECEKSRLVVGIISN
jgi:hypothetical protein